MSIDTLIKRLRDIMRGDAGVDGDAQRLSQIVWILFLKVFDNREEIWELEEDDYEGIIPEGYRWRDWATCESVKDQLTGDELIDFVNNDLIPTLRDLEVKGDDKRYWIVKDFMAEAINYMKDGVLLRQVVNLFDEVDFDDYEERHAFNDIYEELLKELQSAGRSGEFYTPRAITSFCVEKTDPQIGETVADFASGTGGFLIDALEYMRKQVGTDITKNEILKKSIHGVEKKQLPYMLCVTNMMLHGVEQPDIIHGNSLEKPVRDYTDDDKFDVILMNPPYGGSEKTDIQRNFPRELANSETADLFMIEILYRLNENGRVAIVLPDGFLFGTDNSKTAIKKKLMDECNLHTIIRLPKSVFAPYTSIATNLLFFDKTGPTKETWFYRLDMPEGYKNFSKTKPMLSKHFDPVREWWDNRVEIKDEKEDESMTETYKAKKYTFMEIEANGYNLDLCGFPVKEEIILSPVETINNFIIKRESLDKKMDDKLREILDLLGVE